MILSNLILGQRLARGRIRRLMSSSVPRSHPGGREFPTGGRLFLKSFRVHLLFLILVLPCQTLHPGYQKNGVASRHHEQQVRGGFQPPELGLHLPPARGVYVRPHLNPTPPALAVFGTLWRSMMMNVLVVQRI
ncbi:hypothetical protein IF1G_09630 [Cordyceps javanica]|uniref:Uncharacterized protein n=1 Tax=Cordyceps javanica TaxID=43265 RepID=A0A545UQ15_9HYPO|nr:hypothetical protein IF1G_09630 [Cordyceps javanica]